MSDQIHTRLEERWNRAATQYCSGSEFIDYPERVFESIADRIRMSSELAAKKATLKLKVDRDELLEVLKEIVPPGDDWWCPTCKEALDGSRVTRGECCDTCGAYLGGIAEPAWLAKVRALIARAEGGQS